MSHISLILTSIMTMALIVIIAPNIISMNRGKTLRNIAIWLAIFAGLGLFYQSFGPGSTHPLFGQSEALRLQSGARPNATPAPEQNFNPPKEE